MTMPAFESGEHPRGQGGKFADSGGPGTPDRKAVLQALLTEIQRRRAVVQKRKLQPLAQGAGFHEHNGSGQVKSLQRALNRLGITDEHGKPLKVDGKLGSKTSTAVKAVQKKLGVPADGKVSVDLFNDLTTARASTGAGRRAAAPAGRSSSSRALRAFAAGG